MMPKSEITEKAYSQEELTNNARLLTSSGKKIKGAYVDVKNGVKFANKTFRRAKAVTKNASVLGGLVKSIIVGLGTILGSVPTMIIIIFILVPFAITMVFTQQHYISVEKLIEQQAEVSHIQAINQDKSEVVNYLNENYAVTFFTSDISDITSPSDNEWNLTEESKSSNKTEYRVSVKFVPGVDRATPLIASYIMAVNNTIAQYDEKVIDGNFSDYEKNNYDEIYKSPYENEDIDYSEQAFDESCKIPTNYDSNLNVKDQFADNECEPSSEMSDYIKSDDANENMFPTSPKLITSLKKYISEYGIYFTGGKDTWLIYESTPYEVEKEVEIPNYQPDQTPDGSLTPSPEIDENGNQIEPPLITVKVKVNVIDVSVKIPVFYDLSSYKQKELSNIKDFLILYGRVDEKTDTELGMTYSEADSQLNSMISEYYNQTLDYYEVSDYYRYPYAEFGIYTGPSGVNPDRANGAPGYEGEFGDAEHITDFEFGRWSDYALGWTESNRVYSYDLILKYKNPVWKHVHKTILNGLKFQCTTLARAWFKDHYGVDWLHGHGYQMVDNLVAEHGDMFEYGSSPAPGGIFSKYNHVGCIDAVSETTITFSDGNVGPRSSDNGVRVMMEVSKEVFYEMFPGVEFANPRQNTVKPDDGT